MEEHSNIPLQYNGIRSVIFLLSIPMQHNGSVILLFSIPLLHNGSVIFCSVYLCSIMVVSYFAQYTYAA